MFKLYIFVCLLVISCLACKRAKKEEGTTNVVNVTKVDLTAYPLAVGRMWVYDNGDTIRVVSDTVINGVNTYKVIKNNANYTNIIYCADKPDGLYVMAANSAMAFQSLIYPAYDTYDTVSIPATPTRLTQLPIVLEATWDANVPYIQNIQRRWVGYTAVTTAAGTFNCAKLACSWFDEYYSEKGLVMLVEHIECFMPPCPEGATKLLYVNF